MNEESKLIMCVTGHRPNKLWGYDLKDHRYISLRMGIKNLLLELNPHKVISGMALGVDTIFAEVAIELGIPLIAAIPCLQQDCKWFDKDKQKYHELLSAASEIIQVTNDFYSPTCMQKRNEWMVDHSDIILAVWDGSQGGTSNCVQYALNNYKDKKIIKINPKTFK